MSQSASVEVCQPISDEFRRGLQWFSSLAQAVRPSASLSHSVQYYSLFAQTGEGHYLERCEDFLYYTLTVR